MKYQIKPAMRQISLIMVLLASCASSNNGRTVPTIQTIPQLTATPEPDNQSCVDSAEFVGDVTIADDTILAPNKAFNKIWRLKNTGSCTWDSSYLVAYVSGATMSQQPGYWILPQGQTVAPGQMADIRVGMTSPVEDGNYQSYWGLKKENGQFIPIRGGVNGNSFYVRIKVSKDSSYIGNITAISIDIEREEGSGAICSYEATYFVHATISAGGSATATYEINSTAGQVAAGYFQPSPNGPVSPDVIGTLVFDQAGTKTIHLRFVGPYPNPDEISINLRVNGGEWQQTRLSC